MDHSGKKDYLGPPMNALNRSRSRSPSYVQYNDTRRSASPNVNRKSYLQPANRSRSPTPNFTSTHTTKLSKSPKSTVEQASRKMQHITALQIPCESKPILKSEATLVVSDGTDHSDNASEVSDEGYRSLGLVTEKGKKRASVGSQNSMEDAEECGN